jgi:hypothetical protein
MTITARCHCGRTVLEIAGELPTELTCCTCSLCSKRGHLYAYYAPEQPTVKQADCPAFGRDGSWDGETRRIALNARLIDDFEAADWPQTVIDGKNLW